MVEKPPDHYTLLGVDSDADDAAIRASYRALAKQHHPDISVGETAQSTEQFLRIQEAYDVLRDPVRRAQYDLGRARQMDQEDAERRQREHAYQEALGLRRAAIQPVPARAGAPRPLARGGRHFYVAALLLVIAVVGLIIGQRKLKSEAELDQVTVVKVDPVQQSLARAEARRGDNRTAGLPPDLGILSKEIDRLSHQQVARVEAARKRLEAETEKIEKKQAAAAAPPAEPAERPSKVDCAGEGRAFVLFHQSEGTSVSYNGGATVAATIRDLGTGIVLVSKIEPSNRISIGFMKGDKNGTIVIVSDAVGNTFKTFGVDCSAAAF